MRTGSPLEEAGGWPIPSLVAARFGRWRRTVGEGGAWDRAGRGVSGTGDAGTDRVGSRDSGSRPAPLKEAKGLQFGTEDLGLLRREGLEGPAWGADLDAEVTHDCLGGPQVAVTGEDLHEADSAQLFKPGGGQVACFEGAP